MATRFSNKLARLRPMPGGLPQQSGTQQSGTQQSGTQQSGGAPLQFADNADDARAASVEAGERSTRLKELMGGVVARERRRGQRASTGPLPLPVGAVENTAHGALHRVELRLAADHCHGAVRVNDALSLSSEWLATLALAPELAEVDLARMLVLDTETTGLAGGAGTVPFLIGLSFFEGGQLTVEQLFLRQLGEEGPLLQRLAERLARASCVLSYNGKSFDWPLLRTRFVLNRIPVPPLPPHIDLLHCSRRLWKTRLASVRLVNVEREILGFAREGDVDGAAIPLLYADYLRGAPPDDMVAVLKHNEWDVIALPAILGWLGRHLSETATLPGAAEQLAFAQVAARAGQCERALMFAEAAIRSPNEPDTLQQAVCLCATTYRRRGEFERAEAALLSGIEQLPDGPLRAGLHLVIAKLYEHSLHRFQAAYDHALHTLLAEGESSHQRRVARLQRRLARLACS